MSSQYINILTEESNQLIDLRLEGLTWKEIKLNHKTYIPNTRKTDTYINCAVKRIDKIGLDTFKKENKISTVKHLSRLFGISKLQVGDFINKLDIETNYGFEENLGGRSDDDDYINDCVIRAIVLALDITYEKAKELCIRNRFFRYERNPDYDGVCDYTIKKVMRKEGWEFFEYIEKIISNKICLEELFCRSPELKRERLLIFTHGHIFYVHEGVIKDTYIDGFSPIEIISTPSESIDKVKELIELMSPIKNISEPIPQVLNQIANLRWSNPTKNTWKYISERYNITKEDFGILKYDKRYLSEVKKILYNLDQKYILRWSANGRRCLTDLITKRFRINESYSEILSEDLKCI